MAAVHRDRHVMPAYVPPTSDVVPNVDIDPREVRANPLGNRLARYYRMRERGLNVYLLQNGTATLQQPWDPDNTIIRRTLHGGHLYEVSTAEQTVIQTAGVGGTFSDFDPRTQPGLLWWVAADQIGLTDGAAVSSWSDSSGMAGPLTQPVAAKQPLYKTAIQNGLPVVRLDGVNDLMTVQFPAATAPPYTMLLAFAITSGTTPNIVDGPPIPGVLGTNARGILFGVTSVGAFNATAALSSRVTFALSVPTAFTIISITVDAQVNITYRQDGAPVAGTTIYSQTAKDFFQREPPLIRGFTVGARADEAFILGGDIGELVLWERALPIDELHQLEQDAGRKWGVAVA